MKQLREWEKGETHSVKIGGGEKSKYPSDVERWRDPVARLEFQQRMGVESLHIRLLALAFGGLPNLATYIFGCTMNSLSSKESAETGFWVYGPGIPWRLSYCTAGLNKVSMQASSHHLGKCRYGLGRSGRRQGASNMGFQ